MDFWRRRKYTSAMPPLNNTTMPMTAGTSRSLCTASSRVARKSLSSLGAGAAGTFFFGAAGAGLATGGRASALIFSSGLAAAGFSAGFSAGFTAGSAGLASGAFCSGAFFCCWARLWLSSSIRRDSFLSCERTSPTLSVRSLFSSRLDSRDSSSVAARSASAWRSRAVASLADSFSDTFLSGVLFSCCSVLRTILSNSSCLPLSAAVGAGVAALISAFLAGSGIAGFTAGFSAAFGAVASGASVTLMAPLALASLSLYSCQASYWARNSRRA